MSLRGPNPTLLAGCPEWRLGFHPGRPSVTSVQVLVAASVSISYDTHGNSGHSFPYRLRSDAGNILSYLWSSLGVWFVSFRVWFIAFGSVTCSLCFFLVDTDMLMGYSNCLYMVTCCVYF